MLCLQGHHEPGQQTTQGREGRTERMASWEGGQQLGRREAELAGAEGTESSREAGETGWAS